ncbi:MAG: rod shape-determining protein RodA [Halanaerobiaceae bacterium]
MERRKRLLNNLNIFIPVVVLLIIIIGIIAIGSAVEVNNSGSGGDAFVKRQIVAAVLGIIFAFLLQFNDYRIFSSYAVIIYGGTVSLMALIFFLGKYSGSSGRWIMLGPLNFQPAELSKLVTVIMLAEVLSRNQDRLKYFVGFFKPFLIMVIPFGLILLQSDLGTALVMIFIFIVMMFVAGCNWKYLTLIFGGALLILVLVIMAHYFFGTPVPFLREYQLNRLVVFINPGVDPHGTGYNIIQSKIAVGSGELFGKGLYGGTQNQLDFLPEKHTDFIFSVIGEEFGFLGVIFLLGLYCVLLWQLIGVAIRARDTYGQLLVSGITALYFFHILENVGMTMGVMPITGIPLPFVSYGGTFMITCLIGIGLVINVNIRRRKIAF